MTVFGGAHNASFLNDVWVLSTANGLGGIPAWTQLTPTGSAPTTRWGHTAVYDVTNNLMIIFGGTYDGISTLNDVWVLSNANGLGVTPTWTQLFPTGSAPTSRRNPTAVYDATNNRMTIFGGFFYDTSNHTLNDVWVLSNANGVGGTPTWTQLAPTGSIPIRYSHSAVYDNTNNRMIIYGGVGSTDLLNDVWVLSEIVPVELSSFEANKE